MLLIHVGNVKSAYRDKSTTIDSRQWHIEFEPVAIKTSLCLSVMCSN